ncbi:MAG: carbon-nitrogen hydrolase family protein [Lachnospiraceae bacterium]|nr:carbon-nitrogen hydrolase family protein [Lachnospiraceae bacterium]
MYNKAMETSFRRMMAGILLAAMVVTSPVITRAEGQKTYDVEKGQLGVVNFHPKWGDKKANVDKMKRLIDRAHNKGTKLLVFPELCVTGYASSDSKNSKAYKMVVKAAETKKGKTAREIAKISDKYDMWIVYGASEKIEGNKKQAYNSAFVCDPEGKVSSYRKISPVEGAWCKPGKKPLIIDTKEFGKFGLSICHDTYCVPEIARYYAAKGCSMLLNPTAESGSDREFQYYYENSLKNAAARDDVTVLSSNLVGVDGPYKDYEFPGGSLILQSSEEGTTFYAGAKNNGVVTHGRRIKLHKEGICVNEVPFTMRESSVNRGTEFHGKVYQKWYHELAVKGNNDHFNASGKKMKLATVSLSGEDMSDKEAQNKLTEYVKKAVNKKMDMVVFPEMLLDEGTSLDDDFFKELQKIARKHQIYIVFGILEKGQNGTYNTAVVIKDNGKLLHYRKMHRNTSELAMVQCGQKPLIVKTKWGRCGISIGDESEKAKELMRYYGAKGCYYIVNIAKENKQTLAKILHSSEVPNCDGLTLISCSSKKENSMVLGSSGFYNKKTDSYLKFFGTGPERKQSPVFQTAKVSFSGSGFSVINYYPEVFSKMYGEI